MTNFEKYKDEILRLAEQNEGIAMWEGELDSCESVPCCRCDFEMYGTGSCRAKFVKWLYREADSDTDNKSCDKETEPKKVSNDSRSCKDCEDDDKNRDEEPCVNCKNRYPLMFTPKLKPCPFCGGKAKKEEIGRDWHIRCKDCQSSTGRCPTPEEAEETWNRRV